MIEIHKYSIIYADPPWQYQAWSEKGESRSAKSHYRTESHLDLAKLNVSSIAEKNCVLLMWATFPKIIEALQLGKDWGFEYKTTAFVWVKENKKMDSDFVGMGYYTRSNAEILLLFTKGKPLKRYRKDIKQVVYHKIGKHSQKPMVFRKLITDLFGRLPRLEMFARTRDGMFGNDEYSGWSVFGNQVENSIEIPLCSQSAK